MSKATEDYARAHAAVLEAHERYAAARAEYPPVKDEETGEPVEAAEVTGAAEALAGAHEALREAEEPVAELVARAWDANQRAVSDAKQALKDGIADLAAIEERSGEAARRRNPSHPVLNADEKTACRAALEQVETARAQHQQAIGRFKRGVTAEQLEAA